MHACVFWKAQPYLDAIAAGVFTSQEVRDWLIRGTRAEASYVGSSVLIDEQQAIRWSIKPTKQPFKHKNDQFGFGQPEAYPLRAACFAKTHSERSTLNAHHDWTTVIFCGAEALSDQRLSHFQRVITHEDAARVIHG